MDKLVQLVGIARAMIEGKEDLLAGLRGISALRLFTDVADDDVFHQIVAIDDETDRFPLGEARERWSPEALRKSDIELGRYLDSARDDILRSCERIVEKFGRAT